MLLLLLVPRPSSQGTGREIRDKQGRSGLLDQLQDSPFWAAMGGRRKGSQTRIKLLLPSRLLFFPATEPETLLVGRQILVSCHGGFDLAQEVQALGEWRGRAIPRHQEPPGNQGNAGSNLLFFFPFGSISADGLPYLFPFYLLLSSCTSGSTERVKRSLFCACIAQCTASSDGVDACSTTVGMSSPCNYDAMSPGNETASICHLC